MSTHARFSINTGNYNAICYSRPRIKTVPYIKERIPKFDDVDDKLELKKIKIVSDSLYKVNHNDIFNHVYCTDLGNVVF